LNYNHSFKLADGITAKFINAGHVLGAAQILIDWEGTQILYTADINNRITPMFDGFEIPNEEIDVLLTESTNGDRYVPERSKINVGLKLIAKQLTSEKHKMILPSFAVGRSQETLITLALDEDLNDVPIYIDGMINVMNMITEHYLSEKWVSKRLLNQLKDANLQSPFEKSNFIPVNSISDRTHDARRYIARNSEGSIIVTTSGMLEGGPVHTYLELCGDNEENVIGFTGYQVDGTLGREIYDGERHITLESNRGRKKNMILKSKVMKFPYSGHSSVDGLKHLMKETNAQDIILVHGDKRNQEYILNYVSDIAKPRILQEGLKTKLLSA
jgi:Cft2 family RNA processing exonuclease